MGCFSACFGRCSNRYSKIERFTVLDQKNEHTREAQIADPLKINAEIEDKNGVQFHSSATKKFTFDSNVKIHEYVCETQSREFANPLAGEKGKGSGTRKQRKNEFRAFLYSKEREEEKTDGEQGKNQSKFFSDSSTKEKPKEEKTNGEQRKNLGKILSDSSEKEKPEEEKTEGEPGKNQANTLSDLSEKEKPDKEKRNGEQDGDQVEHILSDSSQSSLFTYPPNDRYKNCATTDDECEDTAINESNSAGEVVRTCKVKDGHPGPMIQEESSESLFSLSIDSRKQSSTPELGDNEVSSPFKPRDKVMNGQGGARDRTQYINSILNPTENLGQWKVARTDTTLSMKNLEKENVNNWEELTMAFAGKENLNLESQFIIPFCEEPTVKQSKRIPNRPKDDGIAVDTSLSSWLVESENNLVKESSTGSIGNSSTKKTKSPKSFEDRPILGALTLDELKEMSRHSSPRRSPSFSPEETPIVGTVGSYWRHTGQAMDADSGSSYKRLSSGSSISGHCRKGKMNGQTSPFQARLEEAVDSVAAEV